MVTCNKCNSGYFLYPNTYLFQVFDDDKQLVNSSADPTTVYANFLSYNVLTENHLLMNPFMLQCKKTEVCSLQLNAPVFHWLTKGTKLPGVRVLQQVRCVPG